MATQPSLAHHQPCQEGPDKNQHLEFYEGPVSTDMWQKYSDRAHKAGGSCLFSSRPAGLPQRKAGPKEGSSLLGRSPPMPSEDITACFGSRASSSLGLERIVGLAGDPQNLTYSEKSGEPHGDPGNVGGDGQGWKANKQKWKQRPDDLVQLEVRNPAGHEQIAGKGRGDQPDLHV
jgi:hypothetical protein